MNDAAYRSRRASADDLSQLMVLWQNCGLDASALEKRFTEFQLIEDAEGRVAGAIGLRIHEQQAMVHSESFPDFGLVDTLRPQLWQRIKNVAASYGLVRLWTFETAPFWRQEDFVSADDATLARLPESFGPRDIRWLTLKLRDEAALDDFMTQELAAFKKAEKEHNERLLQQAGLLKTLATLIAFGALVVVAYVIYQMFRKNPL